ncbi:MAG: beta-glucosidase family protein [Promethearchaeota archaeon]
MSKTKLDWFKFKSLNEQEIEEKAKEILGLMTLKEKIKQMSGDGTLLRNLIPMAIRYNRKPLPAGVNKNLGIPGVRFSDGPRGIVMGKATCFPVSMARGASWDIDLEERIGNAIGIEARAKGANYFGGVCINLLRHPAWGRAQETYGEDPYHLGEMGVALIKGTQKHVMACAKHYACNSMENTRFKVDVKVDERTLREIYLPHFKKCVDAGVASIMNAYNKVNGKYCGHNKHLLTDILKNDWKFEGFVITDFILGIRKGNLAVNAGVDIEMPFQWRMKPRKLIKYLKNGEITEDQINESVLRILKMLIRFEQKGDVDLYTKDKILCADYVNLALEAARKSIVLLKNEGNILPLNREKINKIAVIGKLADLDNTGDHGSSRVYPPHVITSLEGIKKAAGNSIEIFYNNGESVQEKKDIIKNSDVVIIVVGYTHADEGEYVRTKGGDRDSLRLKQIDEELILSVSAINSNCIVVLEGGSAIITENWNDKVPAMIMAWYLGMEGGTALGEIIFGDFNPCGKLPMVFPKSQDQLPYFDKNALEIEYKYYHGYRLMDKNDYKPAFPFGFGMSYTTFSYKNLNIEKNTINKSENIKISIDITNTGDIAGEEIAQMYVGYTNPAVERPIKDLKGFLKVKLNPGETKTLTFNLNGKDLAYYNKEKSEWVIEEIEYIVLVGPSSKAEDLLKINFKISS